MGARGTKGIQLLLTIPVLFLLEASPLLVDLTNAVLHFAELLPALVSAL